MPFLSDSDQERLRAAVTAAELQTSGEIVVAFRKHIKGTVEDAARSFFVKNDLHKTVQRNAVLVLIAFGDRQLAVIGDEGINSRVSDTFWNEVVGNITKAFGTGDIIGGLEAGISQIGLQLKELFPRTDDDVNELPDEVRLDA